MKIYFFTKQNLCWAGIALLLMTGLSVYSLVFWHEDSVASLGEAIYQGNSGQKAVAMTVNVDWGEEFIPAMLKEFKEHKAQATFFVTGQWAEKNPELLKQMKKEGHSIQNHGFKHLHFNSLAAEQAQTQIKQAEAVIEKITGEKSRFFAPPYGEKNQALVNSVAAMNYQYIMWSIDTIDWQRPGPQTIVNRVVNKLHNDAIILMHPTEPTVKALPDMLDKIEEQGYKMLTIDKIICDKDGKSLNNVKAN
ncbi:MAG: polysaccharide deacetylase family protein [Syntrophomonadaceae bacterium]|nr:polysaccharide deacetylase family protein [Syntrophomonadaceae bacterium]